MGATCVFFVCLTLSFFATTIGLQCYLCGQYNDGVGSITPCINYTHMQLKDCPLKEQAYCIKYISEGSLVKDCVAQCTERESWSAKTFCCNEDGCNSSIVTQSGLFLTVCAAIFNLVY
ncbi:hypothetical protein RN001_011428 [Aquatica leii]|uniref:Uncharacterized protein n=1 Tax=Aquatica leii TaxID=1421715 RepID=A0AAN7P477_9COLE|nr:hypothetical protein RN001_011428 [Aquatica leii]